MTNFRVFVCYLEKFNRWVENVNSRKINDQQYKGYTIPNDKIHWMTLDSS